MLSALRRSKSVGLKDYHVVGIAGDGGTADIGIQALSGAIDRRDKIIYVCYDNEAYMNTEYRKAALHLMGKDYNYSGGENIPGTVTQKKNMFEIVAAHGIDYAATASIGYIQDFMNKIQKASKVNGLLISMFLPLSTGWGIPSDSAVDIAKEAVDCGLWYLAEYENNEFTLNKNPKEFTPVEEYLKKQSRFKHLKKRT